MDLLCAFLECARSLHFTLLTHFQKSNHIFQRDAKFVLTVQITKKYNTIEKLRLILQKRDNFWILNLRTLYPDGLNQELNDV